MSQNPRSHPSTTSRSPPRDEAADASEFKRNRDFAPSGTRTQGAVVGKKASLPVAQFSSFIVGGYMLCSATLLVVNKFAVYHLPAPSFILFAQLSGTALGVKVAHSVGAIEKLHPIRLDVARAFAPAALIFVATILLNMKSLENANVETFMVFRFSTPLTISIADFFFLGRQLPSPRSWASLVALLLGALGYATTDAAFEVRGYLFCAAWYLVFCLDQVYLKHICNTVKLDNWSKVYYSNFLAAIPLVFIGAGTSEFEVVTEQMTAAGLAALLLSVALGAAMSYFAWAARSTISATSFTIVGNTCKILTIAINVFLWDKHASVTGIMCLLACLAAAFFYKQAPPRMDVRHTLPQHH